jgi:hypothetical protein
VLLKAGCYNFLAKYRNPLHLRWITAPFRVKGTIINVIGYSLATMQT